MCHVSMHYTCYIITLNQSWQAQLARKETECMQLIEERNTLDSEKLAYMRHISRLQMEKVGNTIYSYGIWYVIIVFRVVKSK